MASISVSSDLKKLKKSLTRIQKKQVPFALAGAINDLAFKARPAEQNVIRQMIDRPTPFTQKGILIEKANKRTLKARVKITPVRWKYLQKIVNGGTSRRASGSHAISVNQGLNNKYGNLPRNKSRSLAKRKNHFKATINGRYGIWKREAGKGNRAISLQIVHKKSTNVPRSYRPWVATQRIVKSNFNSAFNKRMALALRTAF